MYLGDILPTQVGQITSLDNLDWYNEQVSEYEVDSNTTTSILNGTTMPATVLMNCLAEQLSLNFILSAVNNMERVLWIASLQTCRTKGSRSSLKTTSMQYNKAVAITLLGLRLAKSLLLRQL